MNQQFVGYWEINAKGQHVLTYAQEWIDSDASRPLSLSLPIRSPDQPITGTEVENYFNNLLPDSTEIRNRIRDNFGAATTGAFDLLTEIGRDCVGALQILPTGEEPNPLNEIEGRSLNEKEIASLIRRVPTQRGGTLAGRDDEFRISLAGAQEKLALLKHRGQWMAPIGTTPSTHILKLPLGKFGNNEIDMSLSVPNEWLCRQLISHFDIPIAGCEINSFEDQTVLVVTRFDRELNDNKDELIRLPQEDICQATGRANGEKYEADGGPGILEIMKLLEHSITPLQDRRTFFKAQILFWLLGAIDGHAKNFSIRLLRQGRFQLTPLYDVMSVYPVMGGGAHQIPRQKAKLAMFVIGKNRHDKIFEIQRRHWDHTAALCGFEANINSVYEQIIDSGEVAIEAVSKQLPDNFPEQISEPIFERFRDALSRLQ